MVYMVLNIAGNSGSPGVILDEELEIEGNEHA